MGSVYQYLNVRNRAAIASRVAGGEPFAVSVPEVEEVEHGEVGRVPEVVDGAERRREGVGFDHRGIERERRFAARAFEMRDDVQRAGDVERARRELEVLVLTRHEPGFGHVCVAWRVA